MFKLSIPKISDEELTKRYFSIRPIVTGSDGKKHYLKSFDIFFEFEKLWNCFVDYLHAITEEEKEEIILKFKQMLDFLIKNNNSSDQNIKSSIEKIKAHIYKVKNANLFDFIFTNDEIISKLNQLSI